MNKMRSSTFVFILVLILKVNADVCDIMWGTFVSGEPWADDKMARTIALDTALDRSSYIVHWYANWGDGSGDFGWNIPYHLNIIRNFVSVGNGEHIPMLSWQPFAPRFSTTPPFDFPLADIASGRFDTYIDTWATGIKSLNYTFFLRPMHEMDGDWYPWGQVGGNTPAQYIAAWRRIHGRFSAQNVQNVKFVWCPNNSNKDGTDQTVFFPGDSYVDWICLDAYAADTGTSFAQTITTHCNPQNPYDRLVAISTKPMMIAEWGVNEPANGNQISKGQWYINAAAEIPVRFPRIKALVYFDQYGYAFNTSQNALNGARQAFGGCATTTTSSATTSATTTSGTSSTTSPLPSTSSDTSGGGLVSTTGDNATTGGTTPNGDDSPKSESSSGNKNYGTSFVVLFAVLVYVINVIY